MPTYSTIRDCPNYAGCSTLDAVIERLAIEHAALAQMRSLGVVFHGVDTFGVHLATSAPNVAAKYGFKEDRAPAPVVEPAKPVTPAKAAPPPKRAWNE